MSTKPRDDWESLSGEQRRKFTDQLLQIYGWTCYICSMPIKTRAEASCEHTIPRSKGGTTSIESCRPSHLRCNVQKGAREYVGNVIRHDDRAFFGRK